MHGDSIEQAKQALEGILDALQPHDHVTLIAFGNTTNLLSNRLLPCNKTNLGKAKRFAKQLGATMGGTEIGEALRDAYAVVSGSESADIFLVTDGEVSDWEAVVQEATHSGHRVFTVGVGSAVSEAFVRGLAAGTGGECELVSPREGMADRVIRHFERMRAPRASRVAIHWPEGSHDVSPSKLGAVFEGDTVIVCAQFDQPSISGTVVLEVETEKGEVMRHELAIETAPSSDLSMSTVARIAAAARLKELNGAAGLETALRYRLVSPWTNWLVIAERPEEEKSQDIPALRKVPQTLAAGWGGVGAVQACMSINSLAEPLVKFSRNRAYLADMHDCAEPPTRAPRTNLPESFRQLIVLIEDEPLRLNSNRALDLLQEAGLASQFDDLFQHAADLGLNVETIAAIVLAGVLGGPLGEYLSSETQGAVASLQDYAQWATDALRELGRHGSTLARVIEEPVAREILKPGRVHDIQEALERFSRFRELLAHLQDAVRRSAAQLKEYQAARAQNEGGAIA